jgi:aminoglycoside phosphotransferase (APT) family kinase protein
MALRAWLAAEHPGLLDGEIGASVLAGGRSNLTFRLETPDRAAVLRRPPLGDAPATAHDMAREFRLISALRGSAVPVPGALVLCDDPAVLGVPFYLMDFVDGQVLRTRELAMGFDESAKADLAARLVDGLADIHAVDVERVGLADLGRPDGYLRRQVERWQRHLGIWGSANDIALQGVATQLAATIPDSSDSTLVHGDYRLDNLIVGDDLQIRAVVDWEMATLGDPLADVGLMLVYWDLVSSVGDSLASSMGEGAGFPPGRELAGRYAERTGRSIAGLDWYVGLGAFKLAVVLEGVMRRTALNPGQGGDEVEAVIPVLIRGATDRLT